MKIIAFGHRKRVGKDTSARFLISDLRLRMHGKKIVKAGFADKVKDVAHQIYGWAGLREGDFYEDDRNAHLREVVLPLIGKTPRQLWIGVGNGVRAATGYDGTWLDYLLNATVADVLVLKDLRFPAEADGVLAKGGWVYKIVKPDEPEVTDGADEPLANYDRWTGVIDNDSCLKSLHEKIMAISGRHF